MPEKFTSFDKVHDEVYSEIVLEDEVHAHNEWMLNVVEDILLKLETIEKVLVNHNILPNAFHCIDLSGDSMLCQIHFAESAFANELHDHKILQADTSFLFVLASEDQGSTLAHCLTSGRFLACVFLGSPALPLFIIIILIVADPRSVVSSPSFVLLLTELHVLLQVHLGVRRI